MRCCVAAMLFFLTLPVGLHAQPLWNDLQAGPYGVGFRTMWEFDATRPFNGGETEHTTARPLRIDIWYPTEDRGPGQPLANYLDRKSVPPEAQHAHELVLGFDRWSYGQMSDSEGLPEHLMQARTVARADAPPAAGVFPLIVYVGGWYSRSSDNTLLAEYLASNGYVFVTTPQLDRGLWEYDFSVDATTLRTRASDVALVLQVTSRLPYVNAQQVAVGGYSTGGIVALLVEQRCPEVDAVFGLDPSYLYEEAKLLAESGLLEPAAMRTPILTLYSGNRDRAERANTGILDALRHAHRWTAAVPNATHGDFSDDVVIEAAFGLLSNPKRTTAHGWAAYRAWLGVLHAFLENALAPRADRTLAGRVAEVARARGLELHYAPKQEEE